MHNRSAVADGPWRSVDFARASRQCFADKNKHIHQMSYSLCAKIYVGVGARTLIDGNTAWRLQSEDWLALACASTSDWRGEAAIYLFYLFIYSSGFSRP
jgi:hypothetical protein